MSRVTKMKNKKIDLHFYSRIYITFTTTTTATTMERLNQLIEEYIMEKFEENREAIDDMYKYFQDNIDEDEDEDDAIEDATDDLRSWLFWGSNLYNLEEISITDWLQSEHKDYFDNFFKGMTGLEMLDMLKYIDDYSSNDDGYLPITEVLRNKVNAGRIEKTTIIITEYSQAWAANCNLSYSSILNMIESRVIPK
jgi:hypothetical protein